MQSKLTPIEEIRDKCILETLGEKMYIPDDAKKKAGQLAACWITYWICKIFK